MGSSTWRSHCATSEPGRRCFSATTSFPKTRFTSRSCPCRKGGALARQERHHRPITEFRDQQRDFYIAPNDTGFWQAALRDPADPLRESVLESLTGGPEPLSVDLLYGDHEGGQHTVSRFLLIPSESGRWMASVVFHWTVESPDPRDLPA
ncbi:MAG: hypothetical protein ACTHN7_10395 [Solirubrobacterales bacterium]